MFDHVTIRVADPAASEAFYTAVMAALGHAATWSDDGLAEWDEFGFSPVTADQPLTRGVHVGFAALSREHVDAFWRAGLEAGGRDDGAPGLRPQYREDYYGGFLRDPDGNSVEAVHHGGMQGGMIDHLWVRVADLAAAEAFYATIAPHAGFGPAERPGAGRRRFRGAGGSLTLVTGVPTEHLHLAFPATDDGTVDAFWRTATLAGYRDNGGPGERPEYHPGYYGAFVLDPDGNNAEVVNHNRP